MIKIDKWSYVTPLAVGYVRFYKEHGTYRVRFFSHEMHAIDEAIFDKESEAEEFLKDAISQIDMANGIRNKNTNTD